MTLQAGTSDYYTIFIDVSLEQPIPHLMSRQEICCKNSRNWKLVRGDVKGLKCNRIMSFSCPDSSLNETLVLVAKDTDCGQNT